MDITLLVAAAENGVIGKDNRMPWHLPADLRYFARQTKGRHLLMGRKTYDSLGPTAEGPNPLPGRRLIVVTREPERLPAHPEVIPVGSVEAGIARAEEAGEAELFVVGGAQIFREAWPRANRLRLTRVHCAPEGDTVLTDPDFTEWSLVESHQSPADEKNPYACTFWVFERPL
ncbi:dihydrofolate reductase [Thiohalorhabdus sp. Cl-TMA]|uniref:Dihydrofolate reductase n=1 Tax=Thiohalorhabdus methylotrophus TaxID=3242694 RepID=A0ABV4TQJ3_9GAMM